MTKDKIDSADCSYVLLLLLQHAPSVWLSFKPLTLLHDGRYKIPLIGLFLGPIKKEIGETCVCTFFVSSLQVAEVLQPTGKNKTKPTHRGLLVQVDWHCTSSLYNIKHVCVFGCQWENQKDASTFYCLVCFSLSMWWQSLSAGPSFSPMYFMMMSLRSSIRALPSISWGEGRRELSVSGHSTNTSCMNNSVKIISLRH